MFLARSHVEPTAKLLKLRGAAHIICHMQPTTGHIWAESDAETEDRLLGWVKCVCGRMRFTVDGALSCECADLADEARETADA